MSFYFGIFGILSFFSFIEISGLKAKQREITFIGFSLFMFVLSFIRWEVGTDWEAYYSFFQHSIEFGTESEFEWGFSRINEFAKIFFDNYSVLLFILGAILFTFQTSAIYKLSLYPITSLLFLWSVSFGNAMFIRQSIATAILFYSITLIIDRNFWGFMLCIGLAMLFHRTSLIFIPAWWLYRIKIRPLWLWIGIGISIVLTAGIKIFIESISGVLGPIVQAKLDVYLSDSGETFGSETSLIQIIIKGVANKILIFIALMLFYKKIINDYLPYRGLVDIYWFGIILYFSTIGISVAMVRLSFAYDILQIVLVPLIFNYIQKKESKILIFCIFLIYLLMRLYVALVSNYFEMFVPFKTIFE